MSQNYFKGRLFKGRSEKGKYDSVFSDLRKEKIPISELIDKISAVVVKVGTIYRFGNFFCFILA